MVDLKADKLVENWVAWSVVRSVVSLEIPSMEIRKEESSGHLLLAIEMARKLVYNWEVGWRGIPLVALKVDLSVGTRAGTRAGD